MIEAQNIQAQLKRSGIETEIETLDQPKYVDRWVQGEFDATVTTIGGYPDPDAMLFRYWHSSGSFNRIAGYKDAQLDRLLEQGRTITDPDKRKPIYESVQKRLVEAAPWVWLYVGYEYRVMQPYVRGFTPLSNGSVIHLRETWLDR